MEVAEQHGRLHAHNHQYHKCKHDEPKHVVHLARPGGGEKESNCQLFKESERPTTKQRPIEVKYLLQETEAPGNHSRSH